MVNRKNCRRADRTLWYIHCRTEVTVDGEISRRTVAFCSSSVIICTSFCTTNSMEIRCHPLLSRNISVNFLRRSFPNPIVIFASLVWKPLCSFSWNCNESALLSMYTDFVSSWRLFGVRKIWNWYKLIVCYDIWYRRWFDLVAVCYWAFLTFLCVFHFVLNIYRFLHYPRWR